MENLEEIGKMKPIFNMTGLETKEGDKENVTIFDYGLAG
jgi:hypothetical protein